MHNILISFDLEEEFLPSSEHGDDILSAAESLNNYYHIIIHESTIDPGVIPSFVEEIKKAHVVHSGLCFSEENKYFEWLKPLVTNWHFLHPDPARKNFSWKATGHLIFIRKGLVIQLGGLNKAFKSADASLAEFSYRCTICGGRVVCLPYPDNHVDKLSHTSNEDEFRFIGSHIGGNQLIFLFFYFLFSFQHGNALSLLRWLFNNRIKPFKRKKLFQYNIDFQSERPANRTYTAVIPTIDRYAYLDKAILSLTRNPFPPAEIIVVDQTSRDKRQEAFYEQFKDKVRVFFMDSPGQSTSRNLAIQETRHEWILLFEDDAEAWPEMIDEHFKLVESTEADASTGVSLAPWKDTSYIPRRIAFYHNSDVLATGNCLVKRSVLMDIGGLHLAYNRGSGADDDLGRRLYLNGYEIVFNPCAIETHHKAPTGGMRVHGAWWRNKSKLTQAFPPATELYTIRHYFSNKYHWIKVIISYINASKRSNLIQFIILILFFPFKYQKSKKEYQKILNNPLFTKIGTK